MLEQLAAYRKQQSERHKQAQDQKHAHDKAKWIQILKEIPLFMAAFETVGDQYIKGDKASEIHKAKGEKMRQQLEELGSFMERIESAWWKSDKEFVMAAVAASGDALEQVSDTLKDDKEVVMIAVAQNSDALSYASDALQKDSDVLALLSLADEQTHSEEKAAMIQVMNALALLVAEAKAVGGNIEDQCRRS